MNPVVQFLTENSIVYLATCDKDHHPRVRPFQFMLEKDGRLYFCTSIQKKVYQEMQYNPSVELTATSRDNAWIRVRGRVSFVDSMEIQQSILEKNPNVLSFLGTPDNSDLAVFCLTGGYAVMDDLSGNPPVTYAVQ